MRQEPPPWAHGVVLVCANQRDAGASKPSCGLQRGMKLQHWLKTNARELDGPVTQCRVLKTGCLDLCPADGVAVAIEPGHRMVVVDPDVAGSQEALLEWVKAEVERLAAPPAALGRRAKLGRLVGKLRG